MYSILNYWQRAKEKSKHKFDSNYDAHPVQIKSLIKPSMSLLTSSQTLSNKSKNLIEELYGWSEVMKCTNILILDNCDDILISEYR